MSSVPESITVWFQTLKSGDEAAAQKIWSRYFDRIVGLARNRLARDPVYDVEDLALSVLDDLCKFAERADDQQIASRDELWALITVIAKRKIIKRARYATAKRRTSTRIDARESVDVACSDHPTPDESLLVQDELRHLLDALGDDSLKEVALLKLDSFSNREIAQQLQLGERTVGRRVALIRKRWQEISINEAE